MRETVVPLVGTWIETMSYCFLWLFRLVVPLVGTWIETNASKKRTGMALSFPSWERGLKLIQRCENLIDMPVVPLVGTWIETRRNM